MILYELVWRLGRRAGIEIARYRPLAARRMELLRANRIGTVIDVGANTGGYGSELRAFGYAGQIISLEPLAGASPSSRAAPNRIPTGTRELSPSRLASAK